MTVYARLVIYLFGALSPLYVLGAEAQQQLQVLEEVIVTAQKREESLQDIGIAITALSDDRLVDAQVNNIMDLQTLTPGMTIGENFGVSQIFIRGIGLDNIFTGADPSVAMHIDGVVTGQASAQLGSMFDLERIEVLRGPQGTLYGRNATGGSINLISNKPTEIFTGYGRFTAGDYDLLQFEGAVGGPVIADKLLGRLAVKIEERDGYGENIFDGSDIDDASRQSVRGQIHWLESDSLDFLISAEYHREDDTNYISKFRAASYPDNPNPGLLPQPVDFLHAPDPRDINADTPLQNEREQWSIIGTLNWRLNNQIKITSVINYQEFDRIPQNDFDFTNAARFVLSQSIESSQFSEELQVHIEAGQINGIVGVYYFYEEISSDDRLISDSTLSSGNNALTVADSILDIHFRGSVKVEAAAVFASFNFAFTDKLNINLGGRYSYEHRSGFTDRFETPAPPPPTTFAEEGSFNEFTPRIGIEWSPMDDLLLYFSYSEGFKSGILLAGQTNPLLDPETVETFEFGLKGRFLGNRLQINASAFSYDFSDLQVGRTLPAPGGFTTIFENAASAKNKGLEVETRWLLSKQIRLDGFISYLDAKFVDFVTVDPFEATVAFFNGLPTPAGKQVGGNRLVQAPEWALRLRGEYEFTTSYHGFNGLLGLEVAYKDEIFFTPQNFAVLGQDAVTTFSANLKFISIDDKWTVNLWGKNLTNELIYSSSFVLNTSKVNMGTLASPRTFGVTIGCSF